MIRHVVLLRFTSAADAPEARERLLSLSMPSLLSIEVGLDVLRTEASYDLCLTTTHADLEALGAYQADPAHQGFLAWVRPRLSGRAVVDALV